MRICFVSQHDSIIILFDVSAIKDIFIGEDYEEEKIFFFFDYFIVNTRISLVNFNLKKKKNFKEFVE